MDCKLDFKSLLDSLMSGQNLSFGQVKCVMQSLMSGEMSDAEIAGFLVALRIKGETVDEIAGAADVMRAFATQVEATQKDYLVDTCGTGGDGANTFNVSTCSALVAAAAGARVAKHGNRSVTSQSGSADVLESLGVNLNLTRGAVGRAIDTLGIGFLFAPKHHGAMRYAVGVRKALKVRTLFNLLGPLTNPAGAKRQVVGVFDRCWVEPFAQVLQRLGSEHVMVVHGSDGLDEVTLSGPSHVAELKGGNICTYDVQPEEIGIKASALTSIQVSNAKESAVMVKDVLSGEPGPALEIVAANAGAAIYVSGMCDSWKQGIEVARDVIASGLGRQKLQDLKHFTALAGEGAD